MSSENNDLKGITEKKDELRFDSNKYEEEKKGPQIHQDLDHRDKVSLN